MKKFRTSDIAAGVIFVVCLALLFLSFRTSGGTRSTEAVAARVEKAVAKRMAMLDGFIDSALAQGTDEWIDAGSLPPDMVLYRYLDDTLQSWRHRFPLFDDGLKPAIMMEVSLNHRAGGKSPLISVTDTVSFRNFGTKWYLVKCRRAGNKKVIAGLEISNSNDSRTFNGVNRRLRLPDIYSVRPLSSDVGTDVKVDGLPMFMITCESMQAPLSMNPRLLFVSLLLLIVSGILFLYGKPVLRRFWVALVPVVPIMLFLFRWGRSMSAGIFSPAVYADDSIFYSLWAHVDLVVAIFLVSFFLFMVRKDIYRKLRSRVSLLLWGLLLFVLSALIVLYTVLALRSIVLNSGISLEIYNLDNFNGISIAIYAAYLLIALCLLMLVQMLRPVFSRLFSLDFNAFSRSGRLIHAFVAAAFFVALVSSLSSRKEQDSLEVWANRIALGRDISLEMHIRSVEDQIAIDPLMASLSVLDNGEDVLLSRLSENYFPREVQDYDIIVSRNPADLQKMEGGEAVSANSHFVYKDNGKGVVSYMGAFFYRVKGFGVSLVTVSLVQKTDWKYKGYASIMGPTLPGQISIPARYSLARYEGGKLINYRGNYAYPVRLEEGLAERVYASDRDKVDVKGFVHYCYKVSDYEMVVVSRHRVSTLNYAVSVVFIALLAFLVFSLPELRRPRARGFRQNYFQTRLSWVIMLSLGLALVTMAAVSVLFVYERNASNRNLVMSEKINSILSSISSRLRGVSSSADLRTAEMVRLLEDVGNNTGSDISLYGPDGMVMLSTAPIVFDRMLIPPRINEYAFRAIVENTDRYYIREERIAGVWVYNMYAPLTGEDGSIVGIVCSPYTDESYDFEAYVVNHAIIIFSLFIFLLMVARIMSSDVLQRMFKPLLVVSRKMDRAGLDSLETIEYDKDDEISGLVSAYNRMVTELSASSQKLAQAERDKAWSGMARQVAHEIKNPLTPMKLQLQRLIRLKGKGDPSWQEKFDEISGIILDHIDILTETANEFSTFAKLYTQDPDAIDLAQLIQEEISIFDNRGNVRFEYIGLDKAVVMGPKPQLTRVIVNLLGNAVQAVSEQDGDRLVRVSLRHSVRDGYYDMVFEDNGPGVSEENVGKLFTPNFTTKNGGSGLGLAISRSVLERCGASISYSRSFSLGGACFTILYPKESNS